MKNKQKGGAIGVGATLLCSIVRRPCIHVSA
jgi:hypothetical protein